MTDTTLRISSETLTPSVAELAPEFVALSDAIWDEPELRWEEHASVAKQIAVAERHGGRITTNVAGIPTAFTAEWGQGGPVIAVLGEFDALAGLSQENGSTVRQPAPGNTSGNGHGCGHNLLGAGSLLAAVALAKTLEREGRAGTVRYYGCPAEEGAAGKSFMVAGGAFEDVDAAVSWHPGAGVATAQWKSLAYTQAYFRFRGVAAHAGANPQHGRSALDAAELMNVGVNFLREHMDDTDRVHYAFVDAGGASPNVVQPTAELYYLVRSATTAGMRALYERVCKIARGAAMMTETEVEIEFDGASAEILPNLVLESHLHAVVEAMGGVPYDDDDLAYGRELLTTVPADAVTHTKTTMGMSADDDSPYFLGVPPKPDPVHRPQMTGSTDVGDVSWVVPTVQIAGATAVLGTPGHSWQMVAQGKTAAAHKGMVYCATAIGAVAYDLLTDPDLLEAAQAEHRATLAVTPYDCPIPEGVIAPPVRPGYRVR
ncbi:amidohydrolase [Microbacterium sediminis]|uniref:amidohydrolase n=1 Tax=Microbacterium sediminis TaxID=904291 RepID=UPI000A071AD9|nr:amidohydrolase [Microbacterium sediminis]QBR73570.1 amidohydrolase [Microbacterium sediminis]